MIGNTFVQNISLTFFSNIISLTVSLVGTFFIPKFSNATVYGYWQLYLFYISYAGLLHFGLCDGIYLKYGGETYTNIDKDLLRTQFYILFFFLILISLLSFPLFNFVFIDIGTKKVLCLTAVGAFLHVLRTFLLLILQSTNRIKEYSLIIICDRLLFVIGIIFILVEDIITYEAIIACDILGRFVSLGLTIFFTKELVFGHLVSFANVKKDLLLNISAGLQLLISGIASSLIIGIIRYGIKIKQSIMEFGKISLSLSVINMVLSFINMVAIVFFPILKTFDYKKQGNIYKSLEIILMICTFGILCFAGCFKYIISLWLPQYSDALNYMVILLPSCVFESETLMLLNTYLKALRRERDLLIINLSVMILALMFAIVYYKLDYSLIYTLIEIDFLLLIRCLLVKRIVYNEFKISGYYKIILSEVFVFFLYLLLFISLPIIWASILYIFVFLSFCFIYRLRFLQAIKSFRR